MALADARSVLQHGLEHRLQFAGRRADDLEHVGGGGLLLQRFRSSLSSRVFSMAMTACAAKLLTNSICLSVKGRTSDRIHRHHTNGYTLSKKRNTKHSAKTSKSLPASCQVNSGSASTSGR